MTKYFVRYSYNDHAHRTEKSVILNLSEEEDDGLDIDKFFVLIERHNGDYPFDILTVNKL
jgi:hypothetical protein